MSRRADAVVIGAGIIGLTTAIRLAEAGADTLIVTAEDPGDTTSVLATAMVGPTFGFSGPRARAWEDETVRAFVGEPLAPGVHVCRGRFLAKPAGFVPPGAERLPGFALCEPADIPEGYGTGFWAEVPLVDMPRYVAHLVDRFESIGGTIERRELASIGEAFDIAARVANCSGLRARRLVSDPDVKPSRGPRIVVANPGIDGFVAVGPPGPEGTSIHPHCDIVVLGGSATASEDTTPDPAEEAAIVERCSAIEPRLRDARVLEHRVGLRPERQPIRVEREDEGNQRLVHNYGHGGIGVTVSWGCATETTRLLLESCT
jgi:D-amino-acid oxidase